jgi:hypothetical protein
MAIVHIPISDKHQGYLSRIADERNEHRKRGEPEIRISDVAKDIFVPALEKEMKKDGK